MKRLRSHSGRTDDDVVLLPQDYGEVYFIGPEGDEYPIKVGWTSSGVRRRLWTLQTSCWMPLKCYGSFACTKDIEKQCHETLAGDRVRNEWFERGPALLILASLLDYEAEDDEWEAMLATADA